MAIQMLVGGHCQRSWSARNRDNDRDLSVRGKMLDAPCLLANGCDLLNAWLYIMSRSTPTRKP